MKNYEKAQFIIEQLSSDGFKFGNAFFHRLELALDKLDAAEQSVQLTGDWRCKKCGDLNGARRKTCRSCDLPRN